MARINTRYGYSQPVSDPDDPWITRKLIAELRTELFDEPDDEHTQVSVGNEHWAVRGYQASPGMDGGFGEAGSLMIKPTEKVSEWLQTVIARLPPRIRAMYVEYTDAAFTQQNEPIVCFNAFGFECLANGHFNPLNGHHVNELGEFTWEPEDDCMFKARDFPSVDWMSVLKTAANSPQVREEVIARGIQFVIGEHDGAVFLVR